MQRRPVVGITMGDPAGIGPEVTVKALTRRRVYELCRPLVVGSLDILGDAVRRFAPEVECRAVASLGEARFEYGVIEIVDLKNIDAASVVFGTVSERCGLASYQSILKLIDMTIAGKVDAAVTGPICKESVSLAGCPFPGHTEIFAEKTGADSICMMLVYGNLRVSHISTHISLRAACDLVKRDRILEVIRLTHEACLSFNITSPRIVVAGLNPHAGENGMFGLEEIDEIAPAVHLAQSEGLHVQGPVPADTVFPLALKGAADAVVAMHHNQGHLPIKLLAFKSEGDSEGWSSVNGVNITLGMPIVRCSVDHGTAFDIAGKGIASADSMCSAIKYASLLAETRRGLA